MVWNEKEHELIVLKLQMAAVAVILLKLLRRHYKIIKPLLKGKKKKLATIGFHAVLSTIKGITIFGICSFIG